MPTARQKIFSYISKRRSVIAAEIARDLRMTPANARHHLAQLRKNGQIEIVGKRSAGDKGGRPVKVYAVSRAVLGDGLASLSHHLLEEMLASVNGDQRVSLMQKLGQRLASSCTGVPSTSSMLRLNNAVQHLDKLGYESRWEAHARGPRLILGHCPYAAIMAEHPELCEMDAALLEGCLGQPVAQRSKLEGAESGRPFCVFAVE